MSMMIPVLFMGGQYNHLIVRALKELGVESRMLMPKAPLESLEGADGLVMGGGPMSVYDGLERFGNAPSIIEGWGRPILGICLSHQLIGKLLGGDVVKGRSPEYGRTVVRVIDEDGILQGVGKEFVAWASHNDEVKFREGASFKILAESEYCSVEALSDERRRLYGVQFHVEVAETPKGKKILGNFISLCRK
uniref:GMP synthase subunit A n=1 Tax=Candidatus Methanomethylicus mesodigestus TaxID=1867258 RepID=A0A7C3ERK5_9CREN